MIVRVGKAAIRLENTKKSALEWSRLVVKAKRLEKCIRNRRGSSAMPFVYTEGVVAEAARLGQWLLSKFVG